MLIATFGASTGWAGKTITHEGGQFLLDGFGPITAQAVLDYDSKGQLDWAYAELRNWTQEAAGSTAPGPQPPPSGTGQARKPIPGWAIALIVVGVVVLIAAIALAVALPATMLGGQKSNATNSAVKEGVHSIQIGIQSWAVDHGDLYPDPSQVSQSGFEGYVDWWPTNPYTDLPMTQGTAPGDYSYTVAADGTSFRLIGIGEEGEAVIAVP